MNPPASNVRLLGSPGMAVLICLICAAIVLGWSEGRVPGLAALVAGLAAARTLAAVNEVRRYNAWRTEWEGMGAINAPPPAKKSRVWSRIIAAALLLVVIPAYLRQEPDAERFATPLEWIWVATGIFLLWNLFALVWRSVRRSAGRSTVAKQSKTKEVEAAPVTWVGGPASFSPSRADAQRNLPEYSARLIGRG